MHKYSIYIHDEYSYHSHPINLYHSTKFTQVEFEHMFRNAMKPALLKYYSARTLMWRIDPVGDIVETLYEMMPGGSGEYVSSNPASVSYIVARHMVTAHGFHMHRDRDCVAVIHLDELGGMTYGIENNNSWNEAVSHANNSDCVSKSMQNSIELITVLDKLKTELKILPAKLMSLDEFMAFYDDTPTNEYEFVDVCIRYDVYKEAYGNNQSIEG